MYNYAKKINLGNGKFAYEQTEESYSRGETIVSEIERLWKPPTYYFHYQKGGHLAALNKHENNNLFSKIDLSKFYYQITKNKIIRSLVKIGFSFSRATEIAIESTVSANDKFVLPFGFYQSSIISSLVLRKSALGRVFEENAYGLCVSVYVDDILISGIDCIEKMEKFLSEIYAAAKTSNFVINYEKSIEMVNEIEIFNIILSQGSKKISEQRMTEFMTEMSSAFDERADAMIRYVSLINSDQAATLSRLRGLRT